MGILETTFAQARAWIAAQALASETEYERKQAMQTLLSLGAASLPSLHAAIRRSGAPRAQFAAAVVLHWLGEPTGMAVLLDGLRWRLSAEQYRHPGASGLAKDLEACFIAIGAPDAILPLMNVWKQILPTKDNQRVLVSICRIWAALRDPRPLAVFSETGLRHPQLFEEYVPVFGEAAFPMLEQMSRDESVARRSLAIRALRHIGNPRSALLLFPLLRDPDVSVRALVPLALDALLVQRVVFASMIYDAVLNALDDGFSAPQAISLLLRQEPPPYDSLLALVLRWNGQANAGGDTLEAVLTALPALARMPLYTTGARSDVALQLCRVLERRPEPRLMAGVARVLANRVTLNRDFAPPQVRATLLNALPHPNSDVRAETARALDALGEPIGSQLLQALVEGWPQANLRDKFQALLRGGEDATNVANQAVQWFTRLSKETVERWSAPPISQPNGALAVTDTRLPDMLRQLLANALQSLPQSVDAEQSGQTLNLCAACIRALVRPGVTTVNPAPEELIQALRVYRFTPGKSAPDSAMSRPVSRALDAGEVVRLAAGQALLTLYGEASFPLFVQALYAPHAPARVTAMQFLGELADVRALPLLQAIAAQNDALLTPCATEAIARIRHLHPETMTLLRASAAGDSRPETLLRPAFGNAESTPSAHLLRPTEPPESRA